MTNTGTQAKQALKARLSRIEGQVRGLQNMLDEERECKQVMQQLTAVRSAVHAASLAYLDQLTDECLMREAQGGDASLDRGQLKELIAMLGSIS